MDRRRRILWRRLNKIRNKIKSVNSIPKLTKLLQDKQDLDQHLFEDYAATNKQEDDNAMANMKTNSKAFLDA